MKEGNTKKAGKGKKEISMPGRLIRPITIGRAAVFRAGGRVYRTSDVVALHEMTAENVRFETHSTSYHLSTSPFLDCAATSRTPMGLAACA